MKKLYETPVAELVVIGDVIVTSDVGCTTALDDTPGGSTGGNPTTNG